MSTNGADVPQGPKSLRLKEHTGVTSAGPGYTNNKLTLLLLTKEVERQMIAKAGAPREVADRVRLGGSNNDRYLSL